VAKADHVLENPVTGERLVFRRTAAETRGEVFAYELVFRPQGFVVQQQRYARPMVTPMRSAVVAVVAAGAVVLLPVVVGDRPLRTGCPAT
jgi:hypothetical protein